MLIVCGGCRRWIWDCVCEEEELPTEEGKEVRMRYLRKLEKPAENRKEDGEE